MYTKTLSSSGTTTIKFNEELITSHSHRGLLVRGKLRRHLLLKECTHNHNTSAYCQSYPVMYMMRLTGLWLS